MQLPKVGELKRHIDIYSLDTSPKDASDSTNNLTLKLHAWAKVEVIGGVNYWGSVQAGYDVTHRFIVRYMDGTRPQDLTHATKVLYEGVWYLVKRLTDMNDAHRFTALECEAQYGAS